LWKSKILFIVVGAGVAAAAAPTAVAVIDSFADAVVAV